jgi:plastocyanin
MKWSAIATLFAAPLALAGALQADVVARTDHKGSQGDEDMTYGDGYGSGGTTVIVEEVVVVWVCNGGGSTTTTVNSMDSVTNTMGSVGSVATHSVSSRPSPLCVNAKIRQVTVGGSAGLVYTPETIEAAVGDMVVFTFLSLNHTATQSNFVTPCEALSGGINSGFMPNINNTVVPPPQMAIQVKVSTPLCK